MASNDSYDEPSLLGRLEELITKAESLCERCSNNTHVQGINKLRKKCQAENKFLQGIKKKGHVKGAHLASSNLSHLEGVVDAVESLPNVTMALQPFHLPDSEHPLCVDVVCNHGFTWVKVIARKAQALHLVWAGKGQFGEKSIVDQASHFLKCADNWPVNFSSPKVVMIFINGITKELRDELIELGIHVQGTVQEVGQDVVERLQVATNYDSPDESSNAFDFSYVDGVEDEDELVSASDFLRLRQQPVEHSAVGFISKTNDNQPLHSASPESRVSGASGVHQNASYNKETKDVYDCDNSCSEGEDSSNNNDCYPPEESITADILENEDLIQVFDSRPSIEKCNLDITTLICLVSNLCHGKSNYVFDEDILNQQAAEERMEPLLPMLEPFLQNKELFVCSTALDDFKTILDIVGGPSEKTRAAQLLQRVTLVPDSPSDRAMNLKTSAKVKERAKVIFGTGDTIRAVTISANSGFVRAANNQGVSFAVHLHGSRALTEQKQTTAKPL